MGIIWWFLKGVLGNLWRLLKHILQLNALAVLSPTAQCQSTELACFGVSLKIDAIIGFVEHILTTTEAVLIVNYSIL